MEEAASTSAAAVLRHIAAGKYDDDLTALENAVNSRLQEIRKARTSDTFGVGDTVMFNTYCGTKYLHGQHAVVVGKRRTKLLVKLKHPTGRFARVVDGKWESSEITVPPSIVDLVK